MSKENYIIAYVMRVDESGQQYQGYLSEIRIVQTWEREKNCAAIGKPEKVTMVDVETDLYGKKGEEFMELTEFSNDMVFMCKPNAVIMGLPLNRAVYDENGKFMTILAGDVFVVRKKETQFMSICQKDITLLNECLKPIVRIFGGKIDTKPVADLQEW